MIKLKLLLGGSYQRANWPSMPANDKYMNNWKNIFYNITHATNKKFFLKKLTCEPDKEH